MIYYLPIKIKIFDENILTFLCKNAMISVSNDTHFKNGCYMNYKQVLLENFFLFNGLKISEIEELISRFNITIEKFLPGQILHDSQSSDKIGILVKGKATIKSGIDGVIIKKVALYESFGAASLFDKPKYLTAVYANTEGEMISIGKDLVLHCIHNNTRAALNYICFLSKKITFLNTKINAYTAKSAESKLYAYLAQLPRDGDELELTVNLATLARMIGVGRATLYRAFEKLEKNGLIIKNDKKIIFNEV